MIAASEGPATSGGLVLFDGFVDVDEVVIDDAEAVRFSGGACFESARVEGLGRSTAEGESKGYAVVAVVGVNESWKWAESADNGGGTCEAVEEPSDEGNSWDARLSTFVEVEEFVCAWSALDIFEEGVKWRDLHCTQHHGILSSLSHSL